MKYHIKNRKPVTESIFRPGSEAFFEVLKEATALLTTPNEPPKTLLKAVEVDVLNEATLLSTYCFDTVAKISPLIKPPTKRKLCQ